MSKIGIALKIDVSKLDKARFFHGKNGAVYADLTGFVDLDQEDQYGNHGFITQSISKEERDSGLKLPILGNSKVFYNDGAQAQQQGGYQQPQQAPQMQQPQQMPVNPLAAGGRTAADYAPQQQAQPQAAPYDQDMPF